MPGRPSRMRHEARYRARRREVRRLARRMERALLADDREAAVAALLARPAEGDEPLAPTQHAASAGAPECERGASTAPPVGQEAHAAAHLGEPDDLPREGGGAPERPEIGGRNPLGTPPEGPRSMTDTPAFDLPDLEPPRRPRGDRNAHPARLDVERVEDVIDRRTAPGRELLDYRAALVADLGGSLSAAQERLVDQVVVCRALVEIGSAWALEHAREAWGKQADLLPWLLALDRLQERELRLLLKLGITRRPKRVRTALEIADEYRALEAAKRALPPEETAR